MALEWKISQETLARLSPYEREFINMETSRSPEFYAQRLKAAGLSDLDSLLDVACGIGQWTIVASSLNKKAVGVDRQADRLFVAAHLAEALGCKVEFKWADMHQLPFPDNSFDGLLCYGALMFGNMPVALREFSRVLKPGGLLYTNANGIGWYLHLLLDRKGLTGTVVKMLLKGLLGRSTNCVVTKSKLSAWLKRAGFDISHFGPDASYVKKGENPALPEYPAKHYGFSGVIEVVARKK